MSMLHFSPRSVGEILSAMNLRVAENVGSATAHVFTDDSREVVPGAVFIARSGVQPNIEPFISQALAAGAVLVVTEADYADSRVIRVEAVHSFVRQMVGRICAVNFDGLTIIGITGTNGKTSVAQFIAGALSRSGAPHTASIGMIGTLGAGLWSPGLEHLQSTANTTPGLLETLRYAVDFIREGVRYVVMEVSSHALAQNRLQGLPIRMAVFTNLSRDHLDYHGTMTDYFAAKTKLFAWPGLRAGIINFDEPEADVLFEALSESADCWAYGLGDPDWRVADCQQIRVTSIKALPKGLDIQVRTPLGEARLQPSLVGMFNGANIMAALAAVLALGMPLDTAIKALDQSTPPPGRMQMITLPNGARALVDYAHTPDALDQVLRALRDHRDAAGKIICVFGCGGDRDRGKRPLMAQAAERLADQLVMTSDNPRSEAPEAIIAEMCAGLTAPATAQDTVMIEPDRRKAIELALMQAKAGDWILIAGKGHETTQEIQGQRLPFDDVAVVRDWIAQQGYVGAKRFAGGAV
ncbi:UDP-N-acetylmuramoyl-L-alanyl-D-glutamate--2,6-diaminopimelate ligase [Halothiobacillus sp.]|uniref:UDP-N-acetylmuramoyl-L-alanyl-D-glutamate--2, 6-diaminopimelate ligase n=1 Tax=Halothiobacillus sp. TaxID=1891311 RepID=UPI002614C376|nr:UDP-N-acetylmuramoyl-L-alanyl-D-glutamate--2,6-diaminopimelate ligase [Halothiobacillus sp.]MDD4965445.1 UDP-N-acetylmuramoyl-L-alanyl-D-glutamate--2,6-diaminopimelate ligase [Halothiobacillus sp.]